MSLEASSQFLMSTWELWFLRTSFTFSFVSLCFSNVPWRVGKFRCQAICLLVVSEFSSPSRGFVSLLSSLRDKTFSGLPALLKLVCSLVSPFTARKTQMKNDIWKLIFTFYCHWCLILKQCFGVTALIRFFLCRQQGEKCCRNFLSHTTREQLFILPGGKICRQLIWRLFGVSRYDVEWLLLPRQLGSARVANSWKQSRKSLRRKLFNISQFSGSGNRNINSGKFQRRNHSEEFSNSCEGLPSDQQLYYSRANKVQFSSIFCSLNGLWRLLNWKF